MLGLAGGLSIPESPCHSSLLQQATLASFGSLCINFAMDYRKIITVEPAKRSGKPCIRGLRITVYDVLDYLAAGMTHEQILKEFPYLTEEDIRACLAYAADRERRVLTA